MPDLTRAHVLVSGRVQGVFFRHLTREEARKLGLAGWVRNTEDGKVEAVFEGPKEAVDHMVAWCREGPEWAVVEGIEVRSEDPEGLGSFEVRP